MITFISDTSGWAWIAFYFGVRIGRFPNKPAARRWIRRRLKAGMPVIGGMLDDDEVQS